MRVGQLPHNWKQVEEAVSGSLNHSRASSVLEVKWTDDQQNVFTMEPSGSFKGYADVRPQTAGELYPSGLGEIKYPDGDYEDCCGDAMMGWVMWWAKFPNNIYWDLFKGCTVLVWLVFFMTLDREPTLIVIAITAVVVYALLWLFGAGIDLMGTWSGLQTPHSVKLMRDAYSFAQAVADVGTIIFVFATWHRRHETINMLVVGVCIVSLIGMKLPRLFWFLACDKAQRLRYSPCGRIMVRMMCPWDDFYCDISGRLIPKGSFMYYCEKSHYGIAVGEDDYLDYFDRMDTNHDGVVDKKEWINRPPMENGGARSNQALQFEKVDGIPEAESNFGMFKNIPNLWPR
jgi:hypothetical protein